MNIGPFKREVLALVAYIYYFKSPMYMAFPTDVDPADRRCRLTPPSPLPCQAQHGNRVTNAHREEVGLGADGRASAPLSGAAADAPPAGTC
jgi:hypothetical protein